MTANFLLASASVVSVPPLASKAARLFAVADCLPERALRDRADMAEPAFFTMGPATGVRRATLVRPERVVEGPLAMAEASFIASTSFVSNVRAGAARWSSAPAWY